MKRIIAGFLLFCTFILYGNLSDCARVFASVENEIEKEDIVIPKKLKKEIYSCITKIYGQENADAIFDKVYNIAKSAKEKRSSALLNEDLDRPQDWYKDEIIYMFYADQFGVGDNNAPNKFKDTVKMLDYLEDLGVTTLYILPFADSPMNDAGFDVKNPTVVRADLGGNQQFQNFISQAKERKFKIKADLVLNHLSDQNKWFQEALNGDLSKLDYFIVKEKMPEYKRYEDEKLGTVIEYKEDDGKISKRRLIFPEMSENHYRKVTIKGKDYYFYHTFYPFQLDLNWKNPEVLYFNLNTINSWANTGIDIFRLDAIPYLIKESGTNAENLECTHQIIKLISAYIQSVAPRSVIQAEACQSPKDLLPYFGQERKIKIANTKGEIEIKRTDEVQIAYNFPYMPSLWAMLITEDSKYFKDTYKQTPSIPQSASWATFLRVHDELTLEMIDPKTREIIYNALVQKGAEFRKGFGVSGRMANFLDNKPQKIGMAFSLLLSLPGIPIIYYGDEIGIRNNYTNAITSAKKREEKQKRNKIKLLSCFDSRDINRGAIGAKMFYGSSKDYYEFNSKIYKEVKELIKARKQSKSLYRGNFSILKTNSDSVLSYYRKTDTEKIIAVVNLSKERQSVEIDLPIDIVLKQGVKKLEFYDLVENKDKDVKTHFASRKIRLNLKPYDYLWLKLKS